MWCQQLMAAGGWGAGACQGGVGQVAVYVTAPGTQQLAGCQGEPRGPSLGCHWLRGGLGCGSLHTYLVCCQQLGQVHQSVSEQCVLRLQCSKLWGVLWGRGALRPSSYQWQQQGMAVLSAQAPAVRCGSLGPNCVCVYYTLLGT